MDSTCSESLSAWLDRLVAEGWITAEAATEIRTAGRTEAPAWFDSEHPPLIVAFFGGTGVGKSTLLNRLAGEPVARTGVERPTSREVTVYLHHDLPTATLENQLPLDRLRLTRHHDDNRRNLVWIDMPDIDSVEEANRELVHRCLPHVDVLVYVVSPERYRDDTGWRMLQRLGHRHGWLFVMNHWDEGHELQIDDFTRLLESAGFEAPIVLRCDSRPDLTARRPDDFGKLVEILGRLAEDGAAQVRQRNLARGRQEQARRLEALLETLHPRHAGRLRRRWREIWQATCRDLEPALELPTRILARELTGKGRKRLDQADQATPEAALFWDRWSQTHLHDALDRLIVEAADDGMPTTPLERELKDLRERLDRILVGQVQRTIRTALAKPGRGIRRLLLWLTGTLRYLLPLAAAGWVGWQVVEGYWRGATGERGYLGIDFAVHSLLLIGLAWLIPFLLHRLLQPSLERVAQSGIRDGIRQGFARIGEEVESRLDALASALREHHEAGERWLTRLSRTEEVQPAPQLSNLLRRIQRRS